MEETILDDGLDEVYSARIEQFHQDQERRRRQRAEPNASSSTSLDTVEEKDSRQVGDDSFVVHDSAEENMEEAESEEWSNDEFDDELDDEFEMDSPHSAHVLSQEKQEQDTFYQYEDEDDIEMEADLFLPAYIHHNLYPYQREGIQWLWSLYSKQHGGILGDGMGLGKTCQIAAFLACLHKSQLLRRALIVCPGSVLFHWIRTCHHWAPNLRVVLYHRMAGSASLKSIVRLVRSQSSSRPIVVIMTYDALRTHARDLLPITWDYVTLDEGHRIRNPDAEVTLVAKQIRCVHRMMLTGTPIQNQLKELWSLFDWVYPGRLGTLPMFEDEFVLPIRQGAYVHASEMQTHMAYKVAKTLQALIEPYLLRRLPSDVASSTKLPEKTEHIVFCHLTQKQKQIYLDYLSSPEVKLVLNRGAKPFCAINVLRQVCNYPPDLRLSLTQERRPGIIPDMISHSGKMATVHLILPQWHAQGHRVLFFCQTRRMLNIMEDYVQAQEWTHCRVDGSTAMKQRQVLIDAFNAPDSHVFVFLLTTRAGGIGINLTGANRVLIFDPDWNPSTDAQARERCWRLGQRRDVTIYRLVTAGTIEEKIYHRQLFKMYLTNKVLKDAKERRRFCRKTLVDLFSFTDPDIDDRSSSLSTGTETGDLFLDGRIERKNKKQKIADTDQQPDVCMIQLLLEQSSSSSSDSTTPKHHAIQSLFNHNVFENPSQEKSLVQMEAKKVAQNAIEKLKQSQKRIARQRGGDVTVPTWTGKHGTAGRQQHQAQVHPGPASSAARPSVPSSSGSQNLLDRIRNRHLQKTPSQSSTRPRLYTSDELAQNVLQFLQSCPHTRASTSLILKTFASSVSSHQNQLEFREMLRKLATYKSKTKVWTLKPDFVHAAHA